MRGDIIVEKSSSGRGSLTDRMMYSQNPVVNVCCVGGNRAEAVGWSSDNHWRKEEDVIKTEGGL